jgi:protein-S-isoprenylcysteine O-methyltransferase Ste14
VSHRTGLGAEHPLNDRVQVVLAVVFFAVWGLDSFVFGFSTALAFVINFWVRLLLWAFPFGLGLYLVAKSEAAVFGKTLVGRIGKPKFITTGVYAWVRHPMYLGSLLVLLGLFFATFSLLSLLVWAGLFVFFDRMATFEERDLARILGGQYLSYQRQVPKWLLQIRKGDSTTSN